MRDVEYLVAYEDGTWQTVTIEVPYGDPKAHIWEVYAEHAGIVYVGVYNANPIQGEDE